MIPPLETLASQPPLPSPEKLLETAKKLILDIPLKSMNESIMEINSLVSEMGLPPLPSMPVPSLPTSSAIIVPPSTQQSCNVVTPSAPTPTEEEGSGTRLEIH